MRNTISRYIEWPESHIFRDSAPGPGWVEEGGKGSYKTKIFQQFAAPLRSFDVHGMYLVCSENMKKKTSVSTFHPFQTGRKTLEV